MSTATSHDLTQIVRFTQITRAETRPAEFVAETDDRFYWVGESEIGKEWHTSFVDVVKFAMGRQSIQGDALVEGEELLVELAAQMRSEASESGTLTVDYSRIEMGKDEHGETLEKYRALMRGYTKSEAEALVPWFDQLGSG